MNLNIPDDLTDRIRKRASASLGVTEVDVIRKALDSLDWHDSERVAMQEGIDALQEGRMRAFDAFDRDFRQQHNIAPEA